ncbi:MAG TPA: hypothetical protein VII69_01750 [Candidatus Eremiobacteraceae bacterium]
MDDGSGVAVKLSGASGDTDADDDGTGLGATGLDAGSGAGVESLPNAGAYSVAAKATTMITKTGGGLALIAGQYSVRASRPTCGAG